MEPNGGVGPQLSRPGPSLPDQGQGQEHKNNSSAHELCAEGMEHGVLVKRVRGHPGGPVAPP